MQRTAERRILTESLAISESGTTGSGTSSSFSLTDIMMPGMDGKKLADCLHASRADPKVLFLSGYSSDVTAKRGVFDPGAAFLSKPLSPKGLAGAVRHVLQGA